MIGRRHKCAGLAGTEDQIQAAVCLHLTIRAMPGVVWFHVPNGGSRTAAEAGRFKALGVKAGVPDLLAVRAGKLFALELKAPNGRLSEVQREMLAKLSAAGAETAVAFGLDEALSRLTSWGLLRGSAISGLNERHAIGGRDGAR